jgi:hypothetical protein
MSSPPTAPKVLQAAIVLIDATSAGNAAPVVIALQYNPDSLSRSFQIQGLADTSDHSEALRLKGPPVETIKLEADIDLTDQMERAGQDPASIENGIFPQLAALETLAYPTSTQLNANNRAAGNGVLEIVPMETPLALFVWSKSRVLPVRITELSITEEAFDPLLNPIRAKVSLGLRVLSVDDLGFDHKGGQIFMRQLANKEQMASQALRGMARAFIPGGIPT